MNFQYQFFIRTKRKSESQLEGILHEYNMQVDSHKNNEKWKDSNYFPGRLHLSVLSCIVINSTACSVRLNKNWHQLELRQKSFFSAPNFFLFHPSRAAGGWRRRRCVNIITDVLFLRKTEQQRDFKKLMFSSGTFKSGIQQFTESSTWRMIQQITNDLEAWRAFLCRCDWRLCNFILRFRLNFKSFSTPGNKQGYGRANRLDTPSI